METKEVYDVGSIPFKGNIERFELGAKHYNSVIRFLDTNHPYFDAANYFERKVLKEFIDKIKIGCQDIPKYPQMRGMNEMFLESFDYNYKEKIKGRYVGNVSIQSTNTEIPEVSAIKQNSSRIYEEIGECFKLGLCITGQYTLSLSFQWRDYCIFEELGDVLFKIVENNIFNNKYGKVELITLDEPNLGQGINNLADYDSDGREVLLKTYERIYHKAKSSNVKTSIHLHSTLNDIFWHIPSLEIIESHVNDPFYKFKKTKELLEDKDKFFKAEVGRTNLNDLIFEKLLRDGIKKWNIGEEKRKVEEDIAKGLINPIIYLESVDIMKKRLFDIINRFGEERIPYAGLECGTGTFPTKEAAFEYLRRSAEAVHSFHL